MQIAFIADTPLALDAIINFHGERLPLLETNYNHSHIGNNVGNVKCTYLNNGRLLL